MPAKSCTDARIFRGRERLGVTITPEAVDSDDISESSPEPALGPFIPEKSWLRSRPLTWRKTEVSARSSHTACFMDGKLVIFGGHTADDEVQHAFIAAGSSAQPNEHVFIVNVQQLCGGRWFEDALILDDSILVDDEESLGSPMPPPIATLKAMGSVRSHRSSSGSLPASRSRAGSVDPFFDITRSSAGVGLVDRTSARMGLKKKADSSSTTSPYSTDGTTLAVTSITSLDKAHKTRRVGHVCVPLEHNKSMYIFGGWNGAEYLNYGLLFNLDTMRLVEEQTKSRKLPGRRRDHSVVKMGPYLLLFGGWSHSYTNGNELWCMDHSWRWHRSDVNGMPPSPRRGHSAVVFGSKMYVFGGLFGFSKYLNDMFVYDGDTNTWSEVHYAEGCHLPGPRAWHAVAAIAQRQILVYGGTAGRMDFYDDFWVFDIATCMWFQIAISGLKTPGPRAGHSMTLVYENWKDYDESTAVPLDSKLRGTVKLRLIVFGGMSPIVVKPESLPKRHLDAFTRTTLRSQKSGEIALRMSSFDEKSEESVAKSFKSSASSGLSKAFALKSETREERMLDLVDPTTTPLITTTPSITEINSIELMDDIFELTLSTSLPL